MKQNRFVSIYLIILILVSAAAGYLYFILQQKLTTLNSVRSELQMIQTNETRLEQLTSFIPVLSVESAAWAKTLPSSENDVAQFAALMEQFAKQQNLAVTIHFDDFPTTTSISGKQMTTLGTDITLEGSFQGISSFVTQLSDANYFYKIDKLTFTKQETKPGVKATLNGLLVMNINVP